MSQCFYEVVISGEQNVGKRGIFNAYIYNDYGYPGRFFPRKTKLFDLSGKKQVLLEINTLSGLEKKSPSVNFSFKSAKAIILVYDITNEKSFTQLKEYWYKKVMELCEKDIILVVAGNKCDLYDDGVINDETGVEFAKSIGAAFFLTSSRRNLNIQKMFEYIGNKIFDKFVKNTKKVGPNSKDPDGKNKKCEIY